MTVEEVFFFIKMSMLVECVMFWHLFYVWLPCSCRCASAVEGNKQADTEPAGCGLRSSPISLESQLRASNSLKCSLSGNVDISQAMQLVCVRQHLSQRLSCLSLPVPEQDVFWKNSGHRKIGTELVIGRHALCLQKSSQYQKKTHLLPRMFIL